MHDPIMTYIRIIEDLQRMAATTEPLDPILIWEIEEAKEELAKHGYVYLDLDGKGYERPFRLVPAIRKCYRCGKTTTTTDVCCL